MIYLMTSDGYNENLILEHYAESKQDMIKIISNYYNDMFGEQCRYFEFNFDTGMVSFKSINDSQFTTDEDWTDQRFQFVKIERII